MTDRNQQPVPDRDPPVRGHTRSRERTLSPDIARGLMLLGIALANGTTAWLMFGTNTSPIPPVSSVDTVVEVILGVIGHSRGLPIFALLFGFGIGMLAVREWSRGTPWVGARKLMGRRYRALLLFGVLHMVFLFFGDILVMYAVFGLVAMLMVPWSDKTLLWFSGVLFGLFVVMTAGMALMGVAVAGFADGADAQFADGAGELIGRENPVLMMAGLEELQGTYLAQLIAGVGTLVITPFTVIFAAPQLFSLILLGIVVARKGILTDAESHLKLLRTVAAIGITAAVVTGVPAGLAAAGVLESIAWPTMSQIAGNLAGPGIVAAIVLAMRGLQRQQRDAAEAGVAPPKLPLPLEALKSLGQRSMSGYVLQSILFIVLTSGWGVNAFNGASVTVVVLWSVLIWLITLVAAQSMAAAGKPGPLEKLHRRMTYGAADSRAV